MEKMNIVGRKRELKLTSEVPKTKKIKGVEDDDDLTLLVLNDDCLIHVYSFLDITDVLTLAKISERLGNVADAHYKRVKQFQWKGSDEVGEADNLAEKIFRKIGQHLIELVIFGLFNVQANYSSVFTAVRENCTNLKSIELNSCGVDNLWVEYVASHPTLERLTFKSSNCKFTSFPVMPRLKEFNLQLCRNLSLDQLNGIFNNVHIESFSFEYSPFKVLESRPFAFDLEPISRMVNLKNLCLVIDAAAVDNLDKLLQLNVLVKLKLSCRTRLNVNEILTKLAEKGTLEELEISNFVVCRDTFTALSNMKLKALNIDRPKIDNALGIREIFRRLTALQDLKHLTLSIYGDNADVLSIEDMLKLIEKLTMLEELNLYHLDCDYGNPGCDADISTFIKNIDAILQKCHRPKLKLILPWAIMEELFRYEGYVRDKVIIKT